MASGSGEILIVLCTFPDRETANKLGLEAVRQKLAACVNILPSVESHYWWQGKIETANETMAMLKCPEPGFPDLRTFLQREHPYEVPEILALAVRDGFDAYLRWVSESCARE
jgi:periplasmic divalent cation tolerance protein